MGVEFIGDPNKPQTFEDEDIEFEDGEQLLFFEPEEPDFFVNNLDIDDGDSDYDPDGEFAEFLTDSECDNEGGDAVLDCEELEEEFEDLETDSEEQGNSDNGFETDDYTSGDSAEESDMEESKPGLVSVVVATNESIDSNVRLDEKNIADGQNVFETGGDTSNT